MRSAAAAVAVLLFSVPLHAEEPSVSSAACERLAASLKLSNTTVTAAQPVAAGRFTPPGGGAAARAAASLPAFCRVLLTKAESFACTRP